MDEQTQNPEEGQEKEQEDPKHAQSREFQKRISMILKANLPDYEKQDLPVAFAHFHSVVTKDEDMAAYMAGEPKSWIMLMHVIDKYQAVKRIQDVAKEIIGEDGETEIFSHDMIRKELAIIEQRAMEAMISQYVQMMSMLGGMMGGEKAGAGGPGKASILSQMTGGGGIQVVSMDDIGDLGLGDMKVSGGGDEKPN